ncbi:MAG: hypothetical protein IBX55_01115 [Methyloprofundus sp.]|nr:hypothetical protein [Methyloprofundus sp.]
MSQSLEEFREDITKLSHWYMMKALSRIDLVGSKFEGKLGIVSNSENKVVAEGVLVDDGEPDFQSDPREVEIEFYLTLGVIDRVIVRDKELGFEYGVASDIGDVKFEHILDQAFVVGKYHTGKGLAYLGSVDNNPLWAIWHAANELDNGGLVGFFQPDGVRGMISYAYMNGVGESPGFNIQDVPVVVRSSKESLEGLHCTQASARKDYMNEISSDGEMETESENRP